MERSLSRSIAGLPWMPLFRYVCSVARTYCLVIDHNVIASWTRSKKDKTGWQRPQTIAHRGYKAKYPENTMGAFVGAVEAGADAIETDIHLSKDGVVVISHVCSSDGTLNDGRRADSVVLGRYTAKMLWKGR